MTIPLADIVQKKKIAPPVAVTIAHVYVNSEAKLER